MSNALGHLIIVAASVIIGGYFWLAIVWLTLWGIGL